jgi:hypothetical protein
MAMVLSGKSAKYLLVLANMIFARACVSSAARFLDDWMLPGTRGLGNTDLDKRYTLA